MADADRWIVQAAGEPVSPVIFRPVDRAKGPEEVDGWTHELSRTQVAQPAVCLASLLYGRQLANLGITPSIVGGHSLGEVSALHAAGAYDAEALMKLATVRGRALAATPDRLGAMAGLACAVEDAESIISGVGGVVVVANLNGPMQTVISGEEAAVVAAMATAGARGIAAKRLPVSNAFHSPLVAEAAAAVASRSARAPESRRARRSGAFRARWHANHGGNGPRAAPRHGGGLSCRLRDSCPADRRALRPLDRGGTRRSIERPCCGDHWARWPSLSADRVARRHGRPRLEYRAGKGLCTRGERALGAPLQG